MSLEKLQAVYRTALRVAPDQTQLALNGRSFNQISENEYAGTIARLQGVVDSVGATVEPLKPGERLDYRDNSASTVDDRRDQPAGPLGRFFRGF